MVRMLVRKKVRETKHQQKQEREKDWKVRVYWKIELEQLKHQNDVKEDWNVCVYETRESERQKYQNKGRKDLKNVEKQVHKKKNGIKNNEDVTPVEPSVVIKEEPMEFDPEPSTSADIVIQEKGDAVPVQLALVVEEEPIEFDPEPSASADIAIKDEFIFCSEQYTGSCVHVPSSSDPTSHVTLSVACLGSGQNRDNSH
ncbi:hypothetical protein CEXT_411081 [Caerostris extrusa]|uniref:Uncharacterized protein n=1 Tax=Caerostris extrusa TaxID=172846 RepID=A0AAV4SRK8_CAEEX|nr:hypothetical protein CEXT_411081 [Caerostris extrusa]